MRGNNVMSGYFQNQAGHPAKRSPVAVFIPGI
jgi:hypothetical protein